MSFGEIAALTLHDVKNRLAELAGRAEQRGDRETMYAILEAAEALTRLLAYYRSESGTLHPDFDAHAPADLLVELAADGQARGEIAIEVDGRSAPTFWFYDEALVRMVLANALHNALRHARARIVLAAEDRRDWLALRVRDDGDGFPESVLADGGASAPVTREGTGLGLRLAKRVAEMHVNGGRTGTIRLANDHGAVFELMLPK